MKKKKTSEKGAAVRKAFRELILEGFRRVTQFKDSKLYSRKVKHKKVKSDE